MRRSKKTTQPSTKRQSSPWQLQAAKARFSELFRRARTEGPQVVTRQGKEQVVVLPVEQFAQLTKRARQPKSLVKFFSESPLSQVKLDLSRDVDSGREIELLAASCWIRTLFPNSSNLSLKQTLQSGLRILTSRC